MSQTPTKESLIDIVNCDQIGIHSPNFEQTKHFYQSVLNLDVLYDASPNIIIFDLKGLNLLVSAESDYLPHAQANSPVLYFSVKDIFSSYQSLLDQGIEFDSPPRCTTRLAGISIWQAFLRDPSGHLIALQSSS